MTQPMDNQPIYVETANGNYVNLADIDRIRVEPSDITIGLASITRYKGLYPVSVLRHSYAMYEFAKIYRPDLDDNYLMQILLHDAAEAYIGDVPAPTKRLSNIGELEDKVHSHILKQLMVSKDKFSTGECSVLGYLDRLAMAAELYISKHLYTEDGWEETAHHYDIVVKPTAEDFQNMVDIYDQIRADFCDDDHLAMHVENLIFRNMYKQGA